MIEDVEGPEYAPRYDPSVLEEQTKERFWCEEHNCMLIQDALGDWICVVCLVEDRLNDS